MSLTREKLLRGELARIIRENGEGHRVLSDEARRCSLEAALTDYRPGDEVWVFGYGSLSWNPAFHYIETVTALLHGYHRAFCMWTPLGRGSPDRPGLVLGLQPGGHCHGVAFRIAADDVRTELDVIWRREMVTGAYCPTWVTLDSPDKPAPFSALTFVMDPGNERYAPDLSLDDAAAAIAQAEGHLGTCREYLFNTVDHLEQLGLPDPHLTELKMRVQERVRLHRR